MSVDVLGNAVDVCGDGLEPDDFEGWREVPLVRAFEVLTAQRSRNVVGVYQLGRERGDMGSGQKRDRRLEKLAIDARGERDATICTTEQRVAAALYAMMADDGLTISV
jgi:hypothetical protein